MNYNRQPAFTIVELLIVIVIIAILATITIVAYNGLTNRARESSLKSDLDNGSKLLAVSKTINGVYLADLNNINNGQAFKASGGNQSVYNTNAPTNNAFCLESHYPLTSPTMFFFTTNNNTSPQKGTCSGTVGVEPCGTTSYAVGDTGPGGGKVFYTGGNCTTLGFKYLEAAPANWNSGGTDLEAVWCNSGTLTTGATGTAVGTGVANTAKIKAKCTSGAAVSAVAYRGGGLADWFLPSKDELNQMYLQRASVGGFINNYYSASSEYSNKIAWMQDLTTGYQGNSFQKYNAFAVRPVRSF
ncbi:MAG: prepilin-type N-terminal cleavage/methylation domain-containing protein [Candidatus Saccharimonas sp.]